MGEATPGSKNGPPTTEEMRPMSESKGMAGILLELSDVDRHPSPGHRRRPSTNVVAALPRMVSQTAPGQPPRATTGTPLQFVGPRPLSGRRPERIRRNNDSALRPRARRDPNPATGEKPPGRNEGVKTNG